jgi:hypothetical protein
MGWNNGNVNIKMEKIELPLSTHVHSFICPVHIRADSGKNGLNAGGGCSIFGE